MNSNILQFALMKWVFKNAHSLFGNNVDILFFKSNLTTTLANKEKRNFFFFYNKMGL